ncbi:MAG: winged helix-turn-helix domain-containing protein, partial [Calditrichaeota bacterium]|nr:winged helix-turn-helix domain-containing protein [Calditrichota bacterium]
LTRKDLANFVGISNATLSRLMSDFQRKKLIRIKNKKIRLLDLKKLSTLARIA